MLEEKELLNYYINKYNLKEIFKDNILNQLKLIKYNKGDLICKPEDKLTNLYLLVKGKLKIYTVLENGKSFLLRFNKPLGVIGDIEVFTEYEVKTYVEAIDKVILISVSYEDINKYVCNDPHFLHFIIKHLSHKLYTISNLTTLNILYPLENRFASYMLSTLIDENNSEYIEEIKTSKLTEIANLLGSSYRHLNRIINKFTEEGIIEKNKGYIRIININKLKVLAKGNLYE